MHAEPPGQMPPSPTVYRLIELLPAVYWRSAGLAAFLEAFEGPLFRSPHSVEDQLGRITSQLDADTAEEEFLPWLAQWAAVSLFHEARDHRRVIGEMVRLYRIRGTREYVKRTLELYVGGTVSVDEPEAPGMALGIPGRSRVGRGTRLGEDTFRFSVRVDFAAVPRESGQRLRLIELARRVIDLAKPAYTHYDFLHNLFDEDRGFVIGVRSTIGVDTLLEHDPSSLRERQRR